MLATFIPCVAFHELLKLLNATPKATANSHFLIDEEKRRSELADDERQDDQEMARVVDMDFWLRAWKFTSMGMTGVLQTYAEIGLRSYSSFGRGSNFVDVQFKTTLATLTRVTQRLIGSAS